MGMWWWMLSTCGSNRESAFWHAQREEAVPDKRTEEVEDKFRQAPRGLRKRAGWEILLLPFYDIAIGPDPARDELRGHAKGFIAIGDVATGVIAIGGLARGGIAIGGCAVGLLSIGGVSLGALLAVGGLAIGGFAFGGAALGGVAMGGHAGGFYACGGSAIGENVIDDDRRDPAAVVFFAERGLGAVCGQPEIRGKRL